ncbi:MAG TPA: arginine--tRNA ligase [Actinomycetota bacterium]|nr:arginine--tRNA ligase [Actinomycetota bacterium]
MITDQLAGLVRAALDAAASDGLVDAGAEVRFERPKRREHGDWATNVALAAARGRGRPRDVAAALVERLPASNLVERVDVAGPGFLNFHLSSRWLHDVVRRAARADGRFARTDEGRGRRVNLEYVSSNPTGPLNVVSGRHAAIGDALANLLTATGHEVAREYYVNDSGRQIRLFGASVAARYLQEHGVDAQLPEDGYRGDYVVDIARDIVKEVGDEYVGADPAARDEALGGIALGKMLASIRASLERFGTKHDIWFLESSMHESGAIDAALKQLRAAGMLEDRDGAVWFRSTELGDDKDRVLVRATGEPTYFTADVAYLLDKANRGFYLLVYLLGADHHGSVPRWLAAADALGLGRDRVELRLVQTVTILRAGEAVKASKRAGVVVPLDELVDDVGADAARYTFLTRSLDSRLDFDIDLAREQAPENPVYYVQYAHARICSILRRAAGEGIVADAQSAPLDRLAHPSEDELMRKLAAYEEVVPEAARLWAPQRVTRYVEELASTFSAFYRDCRVVSEDGELSRARVALCVATKAVIADALGLLGVGAPESM